MDVEIVTPEEYVARAPLGRMFGYATDLLADQGAGGIQHAVPHLRCAGRGLIPSRDTVRRPHQVPYNNSKSPPERL